MALPGCRRDDKEFDYRTVTDIDGNTYKTLAIGTELWMVENLKTTHFSDGTVIPLGDDSSFRSNRTPGYCWYGNDESNGQTYGALYNWYVIEKGNVCPEGWHVPSDKEWMMLEKHAGMLSSVAEIDEDWRGMNQGTKLKAEKGWDYGDQSTDNYGFAGLPGGFAGFDGNFWNIGYMGIWWTSSETDSLHARYRAMANAKSGIYRGREEKATGYSIRCVKH